MFTKVEESLPEEGAKVLCLTSDGFIIDAIKDKNFKGGFKAQHFFCKNQTFAVLNCVSWMLKSEIYDEE